ncbi:hypothetical protein ACTWP6_24080 [Mycobacterium sp. 4D054]|uniref:hypothetical protein n=1 Tax=Mycobacterium sp. 4D054 TaxID=3457440 RepID=UPI003FCFD288
MSLLLGLLIALLTWKLTTEWVWQLDVAAALSLALAGFGLVLAAYQAWGPSIHPATFSRRAASVSCIILIAVIATVWTWPSILDLLDRGGDEQAGVEPLPATCIEPPYEANDWGPDRPLVPLGESSVPAFNNGISEDGRDYRMWMVSARDAIYQDSPKPNGGYERSIEVNPQSSYRIRFIFWNNTDVPGLQINNVRASLRLPQCPSTDIRLVGRVTGDNAVPNSIWGTARFHSPQPFRLEFAPDAGPGHRAVVCWPSQAACNPNGQGYIPLDPHQLLAPGGLPIPGGTLYPGPHSFTFIMVYVRPVFG